MGRFALLCSFAYLLAAAPARAQEDSAPATGQSAAQAILEALNSRQVKLEIEGDEYRLTGNVELPLGQSTFFADRIVIDTGDNRLEASGNVLFTTPEGRIAADRVEYNLEDGTGTFHTAAGLMSLGPTVDRAQFGNQDPDVYFTGETIERLSARRYRITRGSITTCVQPTPRWQLVMGSATLNLDEYAVAHHTVLRVKGVPVMYLPLIYYPIQEDERATGFLMPTFGASTLGGQALSNAFFWAIGRSQDATFTHDWYTRAGQGVGAEYRYVAAAESQGDFRVYRFSRKRTEFIDGDTVQVLPAETSFEFTGTATHTLAPGVRARARVDYASDLLTQQLYHQDIRAATRRNRIIEAGLTAALGVMSTSVQYRRNELINSTTSSQVYGSTPRVTVHLAPRRLFTAPVYASAEGEYAYQPYRVFRNGVVSQDDSLNRVDLTPTVRVPLSSLTFLSVNTSAAYRATFYSRQNDPETRRTVPGSFLRDYIALRSDIVGPVLTRIWDLEEGSFAERMKHVIEPAFTVDVTSAISDYRRTPLVSDQSDVVVGGAARVTYGITNRLLYRRSAEGTTRGQVREFVTIGVQQTYYSNPEASQYDTTYRSAQIGDRPRDLSPVALTLRVSPTTALDANGRVEYDTSGGGLQVLTAGGTLNLAGASANLNYSHQRRWSGSSDDYLYASTTMRALQGRASATYGLSWDIARAYVISQSITASYMAQCCGFQVEYQVYNVPETAGIPVQSDRRFNVGLVLAGLGTFSNFFGAFGGGQ